jgi:hypothetical protein
MHDDEVDGKHDSSPREESDVAVCAASRSLNRALRPRDPRASARSAATRSSAASGADRLGTAQIHERVPGAGRPDRDDRNVADALVSSSYPQMAKAVVSSGGR